MDKIMKTETANSKNTIEKLLEVKPKLAIEYRSLVTLRLDPKNPRLHSDKQIRQIADSITAFGFNVPLLVDSNLQVIAGHGRLMNPMTFGSSVSIGCFAATPCRERAISD